VRPTPTLSIVIPVFDEPHWIGVTVADAIAAVERSSFAEPELVIVDDGSGEETRAALAALRAPFPLRVIRQENQGRFLARAVGVRAARGEAVLLLDARVSLAPEGLAFLSERIEADGDGGVPIWNGHVEIDVAGNPYARFWNAITALTFRAYLGNPRTTSFGLEEFERFPKGTGCLLVSRERLLGAIDAFSSRYGDLRDASDDTVLLRQLAGEQPINISPGFAGTYRSRDAFGPFVRHAFHRGKMFVDGYGHRGSRFFGLLAAFYPLSLAATVVGLRRPRLLARLTAAAPPLAGLGGLALRRSREDVAAIAWVGPAWLLAFGGGMWYGLWLALRGRVGARDGAGQAGARDGAS
jgi:glycosyltransferase involved in cell wall biosynthesis